MAVQFELADILDDAAVRLNVPPFAGNTNITASQALYWAVQSARGLSARLQVAFGDDKDFLKTATLTTTPSFSLVSLPSSTITINSVIWAKATDDYRLLKQATAGDLQLQEPMALNGRWSVDPVYRLEGETLALYPPATTAETLILFYTDYLALTPVEGAATFLSKLEADEWITLDVVIKGSQRKRRDASMYIAAKADLEARLFNPNRKRNNSGPHQVRDVYAECVTDYLRRRY